MSTRHPLRPPCCLPCRRRRPDVSRHAAREEEEAEKSRARARSRAHRVSAGCRSPRPTHGRALAFANVTRARGPKRPLRTLQPRRGVCPVDTLGVCPGRSQVRLANRRTYDVPGNDVGTFQHSPAGGLRRIAVMVRRTAGGLRTDRATPLRGHRATAQPRNRLARFRPNRATPLRGCAVSDATRSSQRQGRTPGRPDGSDAPPPPPATPP